MDKQELDSKVEEIAKTLLSYCTARTPNHFEAEDLAQDIILEIYRSADNIRNVDAIYGFMWAVAGNVYKQWCKNKAKGIECELADDLPDVAEPLDEDDSALYLLRRELSLLSEKFRIAVILYYIENRSCSEISDILSISESMVKYLLFKSRRILKEGMNMERNYGKQSYNPKGLSLSFWGEGAERYYNLCDSKISQNILFACYNDKLAADEISLEIGVALPYMEDKLTELTKFELLKKDGNKYSTNIVIFTKDFSNEVNAKTAASRDKIADMLTEAISKHEAEVRKIGFHGADMSNNAFAWQAVSFILTNALMGTLNRRINVVYPKDKFGGELFVWGAETTEPSSMESRYDFGITDVTNGAGDYVQFMDFHINGEMVHDYGFERQNIMNVFLDIANHNTEHFSENDKAVAADMVRKGYVISNNNGLSVNAPVVTAEQYRIIRNIYAETINNIADEGEAMMKTITQVMKNHIPVHLNKLANDMVYLRLFDNAISAPVALLCDRKYLLPYNGNDTLPTTYVVLK